MIRLFSILFLAIFLFLQAGPAITSFLGGTATVLIIDEDKNPEKSKESKEKKDSKLCDHSYSQWLFYSNSLGSRFQYNESLTNSPYLEIPALPPNKG